MKQQIARWSFLLTCISGCDGVRNDMDEQLEQSREPAWTERTELAAFYSGHSLSDGVPEAVEEIARSRGHAFEFEFQSVPYSLLRERTQGTGGDAGAWQGYRTGQNRTGTSLDVASELRAPQRLPPGRHYDALVVTERHDLPWAAYHAQTATYLLHMTRQLLAGNPRAEVYFYHTWLALNPDAPEPWIAYERSARRLWECVASRANLELGGPGGQPTIRVLPGASALAELVAALWEDKVPGVSERAPGKRVRMLFSDSVHMSAIGRYFLALVHYAVLFGQSPEGAQPAPGLAPETASFMQRFAWHHVEHYGRIANAAGRRTMATCRAYASEQSCPLFHAFNGAGAGLLERAKRPLKTFRCQRGYADEHDPLNPFRAK